MAEASRDIDTVRHFNRFYTRQIGVLDEGLLDSPFTLTQARVLYELGQSPASLSRDLCEQLGLDAGYLSRVLQVFARRKMITRKRSAQDSRQVAISLTALGRRIQQDLDRRSHRSIERMLSGLDHDGRRRLVASLATAHRALAPEAGGSPCGEIVLRAHRPGDVGWAIAMHGEQYAAEYGWNTEFEGLAAKLFGDFASKPDRKGERLWIAELDGERVGCVFVVRNQHDANAAQIRCLLVAPRGRGQGVGHRLVEECIRFARAEGYERVVLWTNDVLTAARNLYQSLGFTLTGESSHHSFGKKLNGQTWNLEL
jgi:DNA-binding MarR family transcriptional regulator/ribosomal protein S18 acetylase RimI-like enzyme